jgi:hypothetical protein
MIKRVGVLGPFKAEPFGWPQRKRWMAILS